MKLNKSQTLLLLCVFCNFAQVFCAFDIAFESPNIKNCPYNTTKTGVCPEIFQPTIAFKSSSSPSHVLVGNSCEACKLNNVERYVEGELCSSSHEPGKCQMVSDPVCGFNQKGELQGYLTKCIACSYSDNIGFYHGYCVKDAYTKIPTQCTVAEKEATSCPSTSEPTCGISLNGNQQLYLNRCTACKQSSVISWQAEKCPDPVTTVVATDKKQSCSNVPYNALMSNNECGTSDKPVVTFSGFTGAPQYTKNKCEGCKSGSVPNYIDLQQCSEQLIYDCHGSYSPVCGVTTDSKFFSFNNHCSACKSSKIKGFYKGYCYPPTVLEQSNLDGTIHKCSSSSKSVNVCTEQYEPVCGRSASEKKKSFVNSCYACKEQEITHYVKGTCNIDYMATHANTGGLIMKYAKNSSILKYSVLILGLIMILSIFI